MLDHECRTDRAGDRTLVEVVVENETAVDRRVRVENRLDGRVEPPRENGVPAPGWDDDGYTGVVPANDRLTLGYACAGPPVDPPVAVHDEGRPTGDDGEATAADAVRLLGDHAPPADAVPVDGAESTASDEGAATTGDPPAPVAAMVDRLDEGDATNGSAAASGEDGECPGEDAPAPTGPSAAESTPAPPLDSTAETDEPNPDPAPAGRDDALDDLPPAVASWLADVRSRVDDAEDLAGGDLATAARVAEERGGPAEAAALSDELADDERALRALATAAGALADRAAAAEVPVEALRRLS